jgi:hypothetical protein
MKTLGITICIALTAAACGHDKNMADPRLIAGGGIGDGSIAGRVNVYTIDGDTDDPVSSAEIYIGEPGDEPLEVVTDSSGLVTVDDDVLDGPTTITVVADGYVTSTWFGADGANVTIPLNPVDDPTDIPQATLSGTIDGWADMPAPDTDHFIVGIVSYSQTDDLGDPENSLEQPAGGNGLAANACVMAEFLTECDFEVNVRTGTITVFAMVVDIDTKGTFEDDTDDTNEIIGFAYKTGLTVEDGVDQSGITLDPVEIGAMTDLDVVVPSLPSGLDDVGVIMGMDTGDEGILMLAFTDDPDNEVLAVPKLEGDFAGATYRAIGFAGNADDDDDDDSAPSSTILLRGITDLGAEIDLGEWLALPTNVDLTAGEYSFTPVEGAALHTAELVNTIGDTKWDVVLLDGRTAFTLPGLDIGVPNTFDFAVSALEGDIDVTDFAIDDVIDSIDRTSRNRERVSQ